LKFRQDFWHKNTKVSGLSYDIVCVILRLAVLVQCRLVSDRRSDGQTLNDSIPRTSIASRGKKFFLPKIRGGARRVRLPGLDPRMDTAHSMKLYKLNVTLNVRKHFSAAWSSSIGTSCQLPQHAVDAPSLNSFKNRLDRHWKLHLDPDTDI